MSDHSKIEWTDATWNPVTGCSVVSPGCANCYAMRLAGTRLRHHPSRAGLTVDSKAGPVWTGEVRLNEDWLDQPLRWRRPRRIFVCAHGDLFHESVPDAWIDRVFAVMALTPRHTFQVLTKRSARMREYGSGLSRQEWWKARLADAAGRSMRNHLLRFPDWPLTNVWLGFSAEDQERYDERWEHMRDLARDGWIVWCSAEPLLAPIDTGLCTVAGRRHLLRWLVAGGESGPGARPMHPDWARSLRDQCRAAGVPFFFKQWGEYHPQHEFRTDFGISDSRSGDVAWPDGRLGAGRAAERGGLGVLMSRIGTSRSGRLLDGREWNEVPGGNNSPGAA